MAIKREAKEYVNSFEELDKATEELLHLLDELEKKRTKELINSILLTCSEGIHHYGSLINTYVDVSIAIKEFSVNVVLMEKLRPSGFLYDYVCRVRDTVVDDNKVHLGGEFYRFVLTYQDKIFKDFKIKEVVKTREEIQRYIDIIKNEFQPAFQIMSNRRIFRKKQIKRLFLQNLKYLDEAKDKLTVTIPEEDLREYLPKKLVSIIQIFEGISMLEYKPKRGWR